MAIKTREKLIEVARQLFARQGVANTTMNDIAEASARGRRTVYTYFSNKKEIYNAVLESESESMVKSLRAIVAGEGSAADRLRRFILFRLEHNTVQASSALKAWLNFDARRLASINAKVHEKERDMLLTLLDQGCASGEFRPARCRLLATFVDEAINRLDIPGTDKVDPASRRRVFDAFVDFIVSDITAEGTVFA